MKDYSLVKNLIIWAEIYESQLNKGQAWQGKDFANWLVNAVSKQDSAAQSAPPDIDGFIAMYIAFMYKYASFYSRKIFRHSVIYSLDDFGVLISLFPDKQIKKAEVIRMNIFEKPSGNEVLKRLLKQKLIQESNNPNDKRSKLIELTKEGKTAFLNISKNIEMLGKTVTGDLSEAEKSDLLKMLIKLNNFHHPLFEANNEEDLNKRLGV